MVVEARPGSRIERQLSSLSHPAVDRAVVLAALAQEALHCPGPLAYRQERLATRCVDARESVSLHRDGVARGDSRRWYAAGRWPRRVTEPLSQLSFHQTR